MYINCFLYNLIHTVYHLSLPQLMFSRPFSRKLEAEADQVGLQLAAKVSLSSICYYLKEHSTDFPHKAQFIRHKECYIARDNCYVFGGSGGGFQSLDKKIYLLLALPGSRPLNLFDIWQVLAHFQTGFGLIPVWFWPDFILVLAFFDFGVGLFSVFFCLLRSGLSWLWLST